MTENDIIARIMSGSCTPCGELLDAINDGRITPAAAKRAIDKRYGGRVVSVADGARIESAHMTALDC